VGFNFSLVFSIVGCVILLAFFRSHRHSILYNNVSLNHFYEFCTNKYIKVI
jgi:hypothetical protein